jgi:CubicO group peptidase (beta-lactamase class C family)
VLLPGGRHLDETESLRHPVTVRHLLTHTAGLTYGATYGDGAADPVARRYAELRTDFGPDDGPLDEVVERLATIPLLTQPGSAWTYGVSTDVLGRVMEVVSGQSLTDLLGDVVLDPLGMKDTGFRVPESALPRFSALYEATENGPLRLVERPGDSPQAGTVTTQSGGAGLVSTAQDYFRFAEMLRLGGRLGSVRVLRPETVAQMTRNQLRGDLASMGQPTFNETAMDGVGFGLGVSVVVDPGLAAWQSSLGEFAWGGYASTAFWVDPVHAVTVVFLTQVTPSDRNAIRSELRALVHRALGPSDPGAHPTR